MRSCYGQRTKMEKVIFTEIKNIYEYHLAECRKELTALLETLDFCLYEQRDWKFFTVAGKAAITIKIIFETDRIPII